MAAEHPCTCVAAVSRELAILAFGSVPDPSRDGDKAQNICVASGA